MQYKFGDLIAYIYHPTRKIQHRFILSDIGDVVYSLDWDKLTGLDRKSLLYLVDKAKLEGSHFTKRLEIVKKNIKLLENYKLSAFVFYNLYIKGILSRQAKKSYRENDKYYMYNVIKVKT